MGSAEDFEEAFKKFLDENFPTNLSSSSSPQTTSQTTKINTNGVDHTNDNVTLTPPTSSSVSTVATTISNDVASSNAVTSSSVTKPVTSTFLNKTSNLDGNTARSPQSPTKSSSSDNSSVMMTTTPVSKSESQTLKRPSSPTSSKQVPLKIVKVDDKKNIVQMSATAKSTNAGAISNTIKLATQSTSSQSLQASQPTQSSVTLQALVSKTTVQTFPLKTFSTPTLPATLPVANLSAPPAVTLPAPPTAAFSAAILLAPPTATHQAPPRAIFLPTSSAPSTAIFLTRTSSGSQAPSYFYSSGKVYQLPRSLPLSVPNTSSSQIQIQNQTIALQGRAFSQPPIANSSTSAIINNMKMTTQTATLASSATSTSTVVPPPTLPPNPSTSQSTPQNISPVQPTPTTFQHVTQKAYEILRPISPLQFTNAFFEAGYFKADKIESAEPQYYDILEYIFNSQAHQSFGVELLSVLKVAHLSNPSTPSTSTATAPTQPIPNPQVTSPTKRFTMMLWHGTRPKNVASILKEGFRCPQTGSQMFGKGVYFADRISKSAQYCNPTVYVGAPKPGEIGYLFLCEVTLGKCYNAKNVKHSYKSAPQCTKRDGSVITFDSLKCTGANVPDRTKQREIDGIIWPLGPTIKNTRFPTYTVLYNEFIVYNPEMVKIKYLVKVQFK